MPHAASASRWVLLLVGTEVAVGGHVDVLSGDRVILGLFLRNESLRLERSHTSRTGRGDGLSVLLVLDVTSGKDTLDGCLGGTGDRADIAIGIKGDLRLDQTGSGLVSWSSVSYVVRKVPWHKGLPIA